MKTAVSLPDDLFLQADQTAKELGMSRSEFYVTALRSFIAAHRRTDLTAQIYSVCAEVDTTLPDDLAETSRRLLLEAEW